MPRIKTHADELYNLKRRINRIAARYEKLASITIDNDRKNTFTSAARHFREQANLSSIRGLHKAINNALKENEKIKEIEQEEKMVKLDYFYAAENIVGLNDLVRKQFYAYTTDIWQGRSDKDKALIEYFEVDSIEAAYEKFNEITGIEELNKSQFMSNQEKYEANKMVAEQQLDDYWQKYHMPEDLKSLWDK